MEGEDSYNSQLIALKNELLGAPSTGEEDDDEGSGNDSNASDEDESEERMI